MFVPVLTYHGIQRSGLYQVTPSQFRQQMEYLAEAGFQTLTFTEYATGSHAHRDKPVVLTFDDAYASVLEIALPILKKYGFVATVFAITKFVGRRNTWDLPASGRVLHCDWNGLQVLAEAGWEIGSHTVTHPDLRRISQAQLWSELAYSRGVLRAKICRQITAIAYPFGSYDGRTLAAVKKAGYLAGCTLGHNFPRTQRFPYEVFRRGVYRFEPLFLFQTKLSDSAGAHLDDIKQKCLTFCAKGSILFKKNKS